MAYIELAVSSGEIVAKHFICRGDAAITLPLDTPCLIIDLHPLQRMVLCLSGELLNVLRKIRDRVPARLPLRHLKIHERRLFACRYADVNRDFKKVRCGPRHGQSVADPVSLRRLGWCEKRQYENQSKDES